MKVMGMQRVEARKAAISFNLKVAKKLDIRINENVMKGGEIID